MVSIIFKNGVNVEIVSDDDIIFNDNLCYMKKSTIPMNTTGFELYQDNNLIGDYSTFTTLYRDEEEVYVLSNDGSVYVPEKVEPIIYLNEPSKQDEINAQLMREIAMLKAGV